MELATEGIDVISYWPGVLQTEEILAGSIDLVAQPAANGNVGQAPAPSLSRRGVSPGLVRETCPVTIWRIHRGSHCDAHLLVILV
jgi:hypothetical protein